MSRAQAHIEKIVGIQPIPGYDRIELVQVLGWQVIAKKGEYEIGDTAIYIEVDSLVPATEYFEFLAKRKYRVKTLKMAGVISQGLLVPSTLLSAKTIAKGLKEGQDVSKELGITKIEEVIEQPQQSRDSKLKQVIARKWILRTKLSKFLFRYKWFKKLVVKIFIPKPSPKKFPAFIVKTDETRIQAIPQIFEKWLGKELIATEKLHGTSTTFALHKVSKKKLEFVVTSRNVRQVDMNQKTWYEGSSVNYYWEQAFKYDMERVLNDLFIELDVKEHIVIQGETIGPSLLGNTYELTERDFYVFNLVVDGKKINSVSARGIVTPHGLKHVPILDTNFKLEPTIDKTLAVANGKSVLNPNALREGLVVRDAENTVSFKIVSPEWLLKNDSE